jgi:hypothetical protein
MKINFQWIINRREKDQRENLIERKIDKVENVEIESSESDWDGIFKISNH